MNAAQHLEKYLGLIQRGWSSNSLPGIQVCLFTQQPGPGLQTLTTLGLSNAVLSMSDDRRVRQELVFAVDAARSPDDYAKLLLHVADEVRSSGRALLRGDVVPLESSIAVNSAAAALYASSPTAYPDTFSTLEESAPPTVFVWLFPLFPGEVIFVRRWGWDAFESRLEAKNPDLFDVRRSTIA
jgi:hypothetical protein